MLVLFEWSKVSAVCLIVMAISLAIVTFLAGVSDDPKWRYPNPMRYRITVFSFGALAILSGGVSLYCSWSWLCLALVVGMCLAGVANFFSYDDRRYQWVTVCFIMGFMAIIGGFLWSTRYYEYQYMKSELYSQNTNHTRLFQDDRMKYTLASNGALETPRVFPASQPNIVLPEAWGVSMAVQPITDNPKVRKISYDIRVSVSPWYFFDEHGLVGHTVESVSEAIERACYDFNDQHSKELATLTNPHRPEQLQQLEEWLQRFFWQELGDQFKVRAVSFEVT